MTVLKMRRLAEVMQPEAGNALEAEGVLNPAAVRGPDGRLYLFPRLVAAGNYSRIGIARVRFDGSGDPAGVERLGIALEPKEEYELTGTGGGGCEDPRITFVEALRSYVMTYTALGSHGPRIALAISEDLFHWNRLGLARFTPHEHIQFDGIYDKDASLFPVAVPNPTGHPSLAMLHRPLFPGTTPEEIADRLRHHVVDPYRETIWISYCTRDLEGTTPYRLPQFTSHHQLATPQAAWERIKIGGGAPPILCRHGWLLVYHGVDQIDGPSVGGRNLCYSAGVMILAKEQPRTVLYRSPEPVLVPESPEELRGAVPRVVFPTGIDRRDDLGLPDRYDVYYGMADSRIGVARLDIPDRLD